MSDLEKKASRKITMGMEIELFDFPPFEDALVLAKQSPVGPKAAKKMMDTLCPNSYELITVNDEIVEAMIIKKQLLQMAEEQKIVDSILEEVRPYVSIQTIIKVKCNIKISVIKSL